MIYFCTEGKYREIALIFYDIFDPFSMSKTSYPKSKIKILFLEGIHPSAEVIFKGNGYSNIESVSGSVSENELLKKISDVHLLGIRSKTQLTKNVLGNANKLIAAGAFCIGTNQIDINTATEHGIAVFNSPYSNTRSVAEIVIANCINLLRRLEEKNDGAHKGQWLKSSSYCYEVRSKVLGIIGYGHIGSQVSVLAEGLGMNVMYYDIEQKLALGNATPAKTLDELLSKADIITVHVPGSSSTKNLMNESRIGKMKKVSVLINYSRGDVLDLKAAKKAIEKKHLNGLAVDVFPDEPKSNSDKFSSVLQNLPNVILTPHIGGSTVEAQENIGVDVAFKLLQFLETGSSMGSLSVPALSLPVQENAHRLLHIHKNVPGVLGEINGIMSKLKVNILGQYLKTNNQIGYVVLDVEKKSSSKIFAELKKVKHTIKVRELY
jgi:D-3-phosphoglycerate dehydrogenase / 2-oxoglutarate reductase